MNEPENQDLYPELADIINRIKAYNLSHPEGSFIFHFIGWKKDNENICADCGDNCDCIDENKCIIGAYGDLETVRQMINDLRDLVEDVKEDGFVNT